MPGLNAQPVGNAYPPTPGSGASLAQVWNSRGGWFSVTGAGAYVKLQYGGLGAEHWTDEILLGAGAFVVLPPNCIGMQFRNSVANAIATVTAQIAQGDEPPLAISSIGQTNVVSVASLNFQHGGVAVGTEPTLDVADPVASVFTWTVADDVANARVVLTPVISSPATFPGTVVSNGSPGFQANGGSGYYGTSAAANTLLANYLVSGDAQPAFRISGDGTLNWGTGGASATDTSFGRVVAGFVGGTSGVAVTRAAATTAYAAATTGDTVNRWVVATSGTLSWSSGSAVADCSFGRLAASVLGGTSTSLSTGPTSATFSGAQAPGWFVSQAGHSAAFGASAFVVLDVGLTTDTVPGWSLNYRGQLTWGPGGAGAQDVALARVVNSPTGTGSFLELTGGDGFGYGTGTGGTASAAATSVTLNLPTGQVTFTGQSNTASVPKAFTVTCSRVGADDTVVVSVNNSTTAAGVFLVSATVGAGSFTIVCFSNTGNASATFSFNYAVLKGARA